jgi:hypothetical protein
MDMDLNPFRNLNPYPCPYPLKNINPKSNPIQGTK